MLITFFVFLIGISIGSFLNVVIYRFDTGLGLRGRSMCLSCNRTLSWYELIPVGSFIIQKGVCRGCKTKISWQYPFIELASGAIFVGIFEKFGFSLPALYAAVVWALLLIIFAYDLRHMVIPDIFAWSFIALAFLSPVFGFFGGLSSVLGVNSWTNLVGFLVSGPAVALPFLVLWGFSRGKWMGFGDVELALGMGWLLGLSGGLAGLVLSFWIGAFIGLLLMAIRPGKLGMKSALPFAPFLIIGTAIVFFSGFDGHSLISLFSFL